jgi:hypothetical protein
LARALAEYEFQDLAGGCLGQFPERDVTRTLEMSQVLPLLGRSDGCLTLRGQVGRGGIMPLQAAL